MLRDINLGRVPHVQLHRIISHAHLQRGARPRFGMPAECNLPRRTLGERSLFGKGIDLGSPQDDICLAGAYDSAALRHGAIGHLQRPVRMAGSSPAMTMERVPSEISP